MAAINSTTQLAKIRSQIDVQQQIIGQLEMELQMAILGAPRTSANRSVGDLVGDIQSIYNSVSGGNYLGASFEEGVKAYLSDKRGTVLNFKNELPEQDIIRHMLYQARALLGELRVEEQGWNTEALQEKDQRKALTDLAKV
ncbi:MAG: hypothetical protein RLZZ361_718 [Cyanobacteriota bacterium]|jgi:hypothetical protein